MSFDWEAYAKMLEVKVELQERTLARYEAALREILHAEPSSDDNLRHYARFVVPTTARAALAADTPSGGDKCPTCGSTYRRPVHQFNGPCCACDPPDSWHTQSTESEGR